LKGEIANEKGVYGHADDIGCSIHLLGMLKKDSEPDTEDEGEILVDDEEDILSDAE